MTDTRYIVKNLTLLAPIVSAASTLLAACAAWAAYVLFHRRNLQMQWTDGFRNIYAEFWNDDHISRARRRLDNDQEYPPLKLAIQNLLSMNNVDLNITEYGILEDLDRYCAILIRASSFNKKKMTRVQKKLWIAMFETYWIPVLYQRPEVRIYIEKYWATLYKLTYTKKLKPSIGAARRFK